MRLARAYAEGAAAGTALVLSEPLSFWGGVDVATGIIVDRAHPGHGLCVAGRVLVMPAGRGSSSSSSVLAEALRRGTGPIGLVLGRPDAILTVACLVSRKLYGIACPLVVCDIAGLRVGDRLRITADGQGRGSVAVVMPES